MLQDSDFGHAIMFILSKTRQGQWDRDHTQQPGILKEISLEVLLNNAIFIL
jgi:hypothetical protein